MTYPIFFDFLFSRKCGLLLLLQIEKRLKIKLPISQSLRWKMGIISETYFWDYFFTKKLMDTDEYRCRMDKNSFLTEKITSLLPNNPAVKILDVGAGPFTSLEKQSRSHATVEIIAVDALAKEYDFVLKKHHINPPVKTQLAKAENLSEKFPENTFDLVYARNSIDHCFSPEKAILEMLKVVKTGGYVFLEHWANEAENENYKGFHQWNFSEEGGNFTIRSKNEMLNFTQKYQTSFDTVCSCDKNNWLAVKILKR